MSFKPLPTQVAFHPDEVPSSFAARLAAANGYASLYQFAIHIGTTVAKLDEGEYDALSKIEMLTKTPLTELGRYAPKSTAYGRVRIGNARVYNRTHRDKNHRFCPGCVIDDLDGKSGPPQARSYVRFSWLVSEIDTCPHHGLPLAEWASSPQFTNDFARFAHAHADEMRAAATAHTKTVAPDYQVYMSRRIVGLHQNQFMDSIELDVLIDFCRNFGGFLLKRRPDRNAQDPTSVGYAVVSLGPDSIEQAILSARDYSRPTSHDMQKFFWRLLSWLQKNRTKSEFDDLIQMFEAIVSKHFPFAAGATIVNRLSQRQVHSVYTASKEYQLPPKKVRALLEASGNLHSDGLKDTQTWFSVSATHEILKAAANAISDTEAAANLGVSKMTFASLRRASLFAPETCGTRDDFQRVRREDIEQFKSALFHKLPLIADSGDRINVIKAARKARIQLAALLRHATLGRFSTMCVVDDSRSLPSLRVDFREVRRVAKATDQPELSAKEASCTPHEVKDLLRIKRSDIQKLVLAGHIENSAPKAMSTRYSKDRFRLQTVKAFHERYVSLCEISERMEITRRMARSETALLKLAPAIVLVSSDNPFYLRREVQPLWIASAPQSSD